MATLSLSRTSIHTPTRPQSTEVFCTECYTDIDTGRSIAFCPYCGKSTYLISAIDRASQLMANALSITINGIKLDFSIDSYNVLREAFATQSAFSSFHEYVACVVFKAEPSNKKSPDTIPYYNERPTLQPSSPKPASNSKASKAYATVTLASKPSPSNSQRRCVICDCETPTISLWCEPCEIYTKRVRHLSHTFNTNKGC